MKKFTFLTLLLTGLSVFGSGKEKITIAMNLEQKDYKVTMTTDQTIKQKVQGVEQQITQTIGFAYTYDVTKINKDGSYIIKNTYTRVIYKQKSSFGAIDYDSDKPPAKIPPMAAGFAALKGLNFTIIMQKDGKVTDIKGIDTMLAEMAVKMKISDAQKTMFIKQMKKSFSIEKMKTQMEQMSAFYPSKPVAIGESWSKDIDVTTGISIKTHNTWTLKKREAGKLYIDVISQISPGGKDSPGIKSKLSGTQKGSIIIDEKTGWVLKSTVNQTIQGEITARGMAIPMDIQSKIILSSE